MTCKKCGSERVAFISAKCSDLGWFSAPWLKMEKDGYLPYLEPIGGGDYLEIKVCFDCGQLQGEFPVSDNDIKSGDD